MYTHNPSHNVPLILCQAARGRVYTPLPTDDHGEVYQFGHITIVYFKDQKLGLVMVAKMKNDFIIHFSFLREIASASFNFDLKMSLKKLGALGQSFINKS